MNANRPMMTIGIAAAALMVSTSVGVTAQDEPMAATVAGIDAGRVSGTVTIDGSVLVRIDEEEYYFSDGTDLVVIDIDTSAADPEVPLFELINIVGTVASDEIEVTSWAPLDIMVAAVIKSPEEVKQAFQGWIVSHGQMGPIGDTSGASGG